MTVKELFELKFEKWIALQSELDIKSWQKIADEKNLTLKEFVYEYKLYVTYEDFSKLGDYEWEKMETLTKCVRQKYGMDRHYLTKKGLKEVL